jgi:hypothetical protein
LQKIYQGVDVKNDIENVILDGGREIKLNKIFEWEIIE